MTIETGVINDRASVYGILSNICSNCKHWKEDAEQHCAAYPEPFSIPLEIWIGEDQHILLHAGDHGIQFEPIEVPVEEGRR